MRSVFRVFLLKLGKNAFLLKNLLHKSFPYPILFRVRNFRVRNNISDREYM